MRKKGTHCKHVGNAHFYRLLCVIVALGMLGRVGVFVQGTADVELFPVRPHNANECLDLEVEAHSAHNAGCKTGSKVAD